MDYYVYRCLVRFLVHDDAHLFMNTIWLMNILFNKMSISFVPPTNVNYYMQLS